MANTMFLNPVLKSTPCNIHTIGLRVNSSLTSATKRTFSSTSSISFTARPAFQQQYHHYQQSFRSSSRTTTAPLPSRSHPLLLSTIAAGSFSAFLLSRPVTRNDTSPAPEFSTSAYSHGRDAKVPLSKDGGRSLNPKAIRQISMGSLMGLGLGVVVSAFSKMLVLVGGLGIVLWQFAARRGYNIVPVERLQRYVKGVNLRSAINDNAAFKISFGLMFALTAFGDL